MKKLLVVFDGNHFSEGSLEFARTLNEASPVLLTGIFLPSIDYSDALVYYLGGMAGPLYLPSYEEEPSLREQSIRRFGEYCRKHGIEYRIHDEITTGVVEALKKETRFSDVMILSSELFYSNLGPDAQKEYTRDTLHDAECPVVIVPEQYAFPQTVILAYDGGESSVYAIRQFVQLFPELTKLPALLVYADSRGDELPEAHYIQEYTARHFADLTIFRLEADPKKYFSTWIVDKGSALLVTGSYGRSSLSELFRKNFSSIVIAEHKLPVFIAHR